MCTLIVGLGILGPGTLVLAANRDENPARPSDPPGPLAESPRVVGGRDRVAHGTWLALRERSAAVAMLNRRDPRDAGETPYTPVRSRGLLTLEVAGVGAEGARAETWDLARAVLDHAVAATQRARYAPFSLAFLSPAASWVMTHSPGERPVVDSISPGWHVLTHEDLDDLREPRVARLLRTLEGWTPRSIDDAESGLIARLSLHAAAPSPAAPAGEPAVCIHEGRMVTVSFSLVSFAGGEVTYRHAEGNPCERAPLDYSALLADRSSALEKA